MEAEGRIQRENERMKEIMFFIPIYTIRSLHLKRGTTNDLLA